MRKSRRRFMKAAGAVGIAGGIAGCSSDGGGGESTDTSGNDSQGTTAGSTSTEVDMGSLSAEEWRKEASERAAEELQDGPLTYAATRVSDPYREVFVNRDFSGPYEPLTDNISVVTGSAQDHRTRYSRQMASENSGMDVMDVRMDVVVADGVPIGDMSNIPAYKALSSKLKRDGWEGSRSVWSFGNLYNPDVIDGPESWEDIMALDGDQIVADFTPSPWVVGAALNTVGEDYLSNLGEKGIRLESSGRTSGQLAAEGTVALNFLGASTNAYWAQRNGLSLELAPDPSMHFFASKPICLSALPEKPWAAKLCLDFIMNQEHTEVQAPRGGTMSLDLETSTPDDYSQYFDGKIWTYEDFDLSVSELSTKYRELMNAPVA